MKKWFTPKKRRKPKDVKVHDVVDGLLCKLNYFKREGKKLEQLLEDLRLVIKSNTDVTWFPQLQWTKGNLEREIEMNLHYQKVVLNKMEINL